jgi:hypothetical protein
MYNWDDTASLNQEALVAEVQKAHLQPYDMCQQCRSGEKSTTTHLILVEGTMVPRLEYVKFSVNNKGFH